MMKLFFTAIIFIFLSSAVFAAAPAPGTCAITVRADCPESVGTGGTHILMGVSSATNAHGEFPDTEIYSHVLCCAFGDGVGESECIDTNTVLKISSATNAHAESPLGTAYNTEICYEDLACEDFSDDCGTGSAINHPLGIVSLSDVTNAHIGGINDYDTKICCGSGLFAGCTITDARWNVAEAQENETVFLRVNGTSQCSGQSITFNVTGGSEEVAAQPLSVAFSGTSGLGSWKAEHQTKLLIFDEEYYFDALLTKNPLIVRTSELPELVVTERDWGALEDVSACEDYDNENDCESDVVNVASASSPPEVDCESEEFACGCIWETETGTCDFGYTEITEETCGTPVAGQGCNYGCTLCDDATTGLYCNVGSTCPAGETPAGNGDDVCDFGEGCLSADCIDGEQDTCASGLYCLADKCSSVEGPPLTVGQCIISQEVIQECDESGEKTVRFVSTWTGSESDPRKAACDEKEGEFTVKCPAQVQLPFFDYIGIITTVLAIAGIYVSMVLRKRFKKSKDKKNKK